MKRRSVSPQRSSPRRSSPRRVRSASPRVPAKNPLRKLPIEMIENITSFLPAVESIKNRRVNRAFSTQKLLDMKLVHLLRDGFYVRDHDRINRREKRRPPLPTRPLVTPKKIQDLLDEGANRDLIRQYGKLDNAYMYDHSEYFGDLHRGPNMTRFLLVNGVPGNQEIYLKDSMHYIPPVYPNILFLENRPNIIQLAIEKGADPNAVLVDPDAKMIQSVLERFIDLQQDEEDEERNYENIRVLIRNGADPDRITPGTDHNAYEYLNDKDDFEIPREMKDNIYSIMREGRQKYLQDKSRSRSPSQ